MRRQNPRSVSTTNLATVGSVNATSSSSSTSTSLAATLSLGSLRFTSENIRPAKLTLTPHHLFFLLSRLEDLNVPVGPMSIRLESLQAESSPNNYMSFLHQPQKPPTRGRSDKDSIHSVSSVRSVMSGMGSFWSSLGLGGSSSKSEKAKAAVETDLKYIYSAFTKIPCLRLSPDHRARLIKGYEEFPFDTAVPLHAFKNVSALEVVDVDFRQFYGWDRLAEQLVWLTVKRAHLDNVGDLLTAIVLDDADRRRRRSTKASSIPTIAWIIPQKGDLSRSNSDPGAPLDLKRVAGSLEGSSPGKDSEGAPSSPSGKAVAGSISPARPLSRASSSYRHIRSNSRKIQRSGSGSSNGSSEQTVVPYRTNTSSNLLTVSVLPMSKWRFLKYLSLADNALTAISAESLLPVTATLRSLDLSSNLFTEIPDSLACLTALRSLDLSNCMIESLHCLTRSPLPAVSVLKLRSNRLRSIAGIERLLSLERLDIADNKLTDPEEAARLTGMPNLREIWVKNNPFIKTHTNHRVTIFNLFRKTPGYIEDIVIDNYGPGYTERKQLIERVAEPERPPVVRKVELEETATPVIVQSAIRSVRSRNDKSDHVVLEIQRPVAQSMTSDPAVDASARRKKGSRRRIVDLSQQESTEPERSSLDMQSIPPGQMSPLARPDALDLGSVGSAKLSPPKDKLQNLENTTSPTQAFRGLEWHVDEDGYRRKVEALKQEMGSNWLSMLGDHGWDSTQDGHAHTSPTLSPAIPPLLRPTSQAITSGGRTLG